MRSNPGPRINKKGIVRSGEQVIGITVLLKIMSPMVCCAELNNNGFDSFKECSTVIYIHIYSS